MIQSLEPRELLSAPAISNNTPSTVTEGGFTNIAGTISDDGFDMVSVRMSTDGGTTWDGPQDVSPSGGSFGFMADASDDGTINYIVEATDTDSQVSTATGTITITNAVPVLSITSPPPSTIYDNQFLMSAISGSISDPGTSDTETVTVNWGDGTTENLTYGPNDSFSLDHQYGLISGPTITITVSVADDDGGSSSTFSYTLTEVPVPGSAPPTITLTTGSTAPEGSVSFSGTINDDITDPVSLRLSIDGGLTWESAGSVTPGSAFTLYSMMTPTFDDGTVNYVVEATDANGNIVTASGTVTVTNVAPTLSIPSPPSGTIHENQSVTVSGTVTDPAGADDPLTVTINWGPGPNAIEVINIDLNSGGSFSASHRYDLPSDQTITITVTVVDGDGGSASQSFSLNYDDILSGLDGVAFGAVDGLINFLMSAHTDSGVIVGYSVDIDNDGSFDVSLDVDSETWDPENVVLPFVDGLSLLGNPSADTTFSATFLATNSLGVWQTAPLTIYIGAGTASPDILYPSPGAPQTTIDATTTVKASLSVSPELFVMVGKNNAMRGAVGGVITLLPADQKGVFSNPVFAIKYGVDFRAAVTKTPAPAAAAMLYWRQYWGVRETTVDINGTPVVNEPVPVYTLDGAAIYQHQTPAPATGIAGMNDDPGYLVIIPRMFAGNQGATPGNITLQSRRSGDNFLIRMLRTIDDELARNSQHLADFSNSLHADFYYQSYVVNPAGTTPVGYYRWRFRVTATATGYTVSIEESPTWIIGSDNNVWS